MSYVLYYAPGAASLAVHWMLIELGAEFRTERLDLAAGNQRSPSFLKLNPAGKIPVLLVDGQAHAESAALLMLLAERHPEASFAPPLNDSQRGKWLEMMVFLANTLSPAMRDWFYAAQDGEPIDAEATRRLAQRRIEGAWDRLDTLLADGRPYLLGDKITTVDFLATMLMRWARNMPRPATAWTHVGPYVMRMRSRPAFQDVCHREALTEWLNG